MAATAHRPSLPRSGVCRLSGQRQLGRVRARHPHARDALPHGSNPQSLGIWPAAAAGACAFVAAASSQVARYGVRGARRAALAAPVTCSLCCNSLPRLPARRGHTHNAHAPGKASSGARRQFRIHVNRRHAAWVSMAGSRQNATLLFKTRKLSAPPEKGLAEVVLQLGLVHGLELASIGAHVAHVLQILGH